LASSAAWASTVATMPSPRTGTKIDFNIVFFPRVLFRSRAWHFLTG